MGNWLRAILNRIGLAKTVSGGGEVKSVDPSLFLFTVPTISNDLAPLESIESPPSAEDLQMHEDDWCQVEFFRAGYLPEVQRIMEEFHAFEARHRQTTTMNGQRFTVWRETYVRTVSREPLLSEDRPAEQLANLLNCEVGPAPVLSSTGSWVGRLKDGFTISVGRSVDLYGYVDDRGIPVLGASVGEDPDDASLSSAFIRLHVEVGLVLVDWKGQFVLEGVNDDGTVRVWQL